MKAITEEGSCGRRKCPHCHSVDPNGQTRVRPLDTADLAWQFGVAESAMGIRSPHQAFVDMANCGIQGGGRTNAVEARAVEARRMDAVGRHACIRARLRQSEVLRVAFSPSDWSSCFSQVKIEKHEKPNPTTAPEVFEAVHKAFSAEELRLAPLTPTAKAYALRLHETPLAPRKVRPAGQSAVLAAMHALFARDPVLAHSAAGGVIAAACSTDKAQLKKIQDEAAEMLERALAAAGVVQFRAPRARRAPRRSTVQRSRMIEVPDAH